MFEEQKSECGCKPLRWHVRSPVRFSDKAEVLLFFIFAVPSSTHPVLWRQFAEMLRIRGFDPAWRDRNSSILATLMA
jgi:hypothetical protein